MEYQEEVENDEAQLSDVDFAELEAFFKSITTPAKQLSPQERVDIRRKVEDILFDRSFEEIYGDQY